MSKFNQLTEPNKLLPSLKTVFAECGRIKQTVSSVQRALKESFGLGVGLMVLVDLFQLGRFCDSRAH